MLLLAGGFASGPLLQVANTMRVPTLVQEQNSYQGLRISC
jgi:UDP-N-acetylglucosamine--N-acetylmuramyl-(pentapeptide) pyrophosphoryl-undecaprenol N-acetylglucosamine transferase